MLRLQGRYCDPSTCFLSETILHRISTRGRHVAVTVVTDSPNVTTPFPDEGELVVFETCESVYSVR